MDTRTLPTGTVTFLFTDIEGSTRLWEQHPEAMRDALARHNLLLTQGIPQHGGVVVKSRGEGDSFFAVFARAADAVAAACALQKALQTELWPAETPLRVRMAVHTGQAELHEGDYYGLAVNRCARLRAVAHGGQVLLSQASCELVRDALPEGASLRDLGTHRLRDLQQPEHLFQLLHPRLAAAFPPVRSLEAYAHNLPAQLTSFIGREEAMAEVKRFLATTRLLTLTGSGGCGKTRLAFQLAVDLLEEYEDGVWLVELAPLADPALVPQTVASVLGVREELARPLTATLSDHLRPKSVLLLLDNCEHLLPACAQLADTLLRACPKLQILATSREGLGIAGELTFQVLGLTVPDLRSSPPVERLAEYEAVRLFTERAGLSQPSFALTPQNAPAVVRVCHRLDGIPLALELAAARVKAMPVEQIASRLDDRFRLLTGGSRAALPRQQTLRGLIDWSYDLLSEAERVLLQRLSVFSGGWTLEAAESVCAGGGTPDGGSGVEEWEVLDLLTSLVEKSLVRYEEPGTHAERGCGEARYGLLETVRQYAWERLLAGTREADRGEAQAVQGRHRDWFLALAEQAEPELEGAEQVGWLDRLEREHDNLRAALGWTEEHGEAEAGLRLGGALKEFWYLRGHKTEGSGHLQRLLALPGAAARTAVRAKTLLAVERLADWQRDAGTARALLEESLAISQEVGDKRGIARSLFGLAWVAGQRDDGAARALFEESLALFRELGDKHGIAESCQCLGGLVRWLGDAGAARVLLEEGLALSRELGERFNAGWNLYGLGQAARDEGDYAAARARFEEMRTVFRQLESKEDILWSLGFLEEVAHAQGDYAAARVLLEESLVISRELGNELCIAGSLGSLAHVAQAQGDHEKARALLGEAQALSRELRDKRHRLLEGGGPLVSRGISARSSASQGHLLLEGGDLAAARSAFEEGLALRRAGSDRWSIAWALLEVGHAAWLQGEPGVTQSHAREALALFEKVGNEEGPLAALESLAVAALAQGRKDRAARLLGAVEALGEALRLRGPAWWRRPHERIGEAVRAVFLQQAFAAAWAEGRALSLDDAIRHALAEGA